MMPVEPVGNPFFSPQFGRRLGPIWDKPMTRSSWLVRVLLLGAASVFGCGGGKDCKRVINGLAFDPRPKVPCAEELQVAVKDAATGASVSGAAQPSRTLRAPSRPLARSRAASPIFFVHAANDYSTSAGRALDALFSRAVRPTKAIRAPSGLHDGKNGLTPGNLAFTSTNLATAPPPCETT